jgi:hypothetical protein
MATQNNETNQENTANPNRGYGMDQSINQAGQAKGGAQEQQKLADGVTSDDDEAAGEIHGADQLNRAEAQVRENEDASLQDDTYTFDSDNTDSDEGIDDFDVADADGGGSDFDIENDDDYV